MIRDLRMSARALANQPAFSLPIIGMLGAAIGLCAAIFSVIDALLLRELPFPNADEIVLVREVTAAGEQLGMSEPNFDDIAQRSRSFAELGFSIGSFSVVVTGGSDPVRARVSYVSGRFFDVLGTRPIVGRPFTAEETQRGGPAAVVVSHGFWQRLLGASTDLERLQLRVDGIAAAVVGVMPPELEYPTETEVWLTRTAEPPNTSRSAHGLAVIGLLRAGVESAQAQAELTSIAAALRSTYGDATDAVDFELADVQAFLTRNVRAALWLLLGSVGLLLVVACANVGNLILARFLARQRELAIRRSLGATRARLARECILELLLLTLPAAALGTALATFAVRALMVLEGGVLPRFNAVHVDGRVLGAGIGLAVLVAVALGSLPALRLRSDVNAGRLRVGAASPDRTTGRTRAALLVAQVATATVLVVCVAVLARAYVTLLAVDTGFEPRGVLAMTLGLPSNVSPRQDEELRQFYSQLLDGVAALPGVTASGGINALPLTGGATGTFVLDEDPASRSTASYRIASAGYFAAMRIPLRRGRLFEPSDTVDGPHVAVVSESLARQIAASGDPLGRQIQFGGLDGSRRPLTIVGIVGDVKAESLGADARPTAYAFSLQRPQWWQVSRLTIVARTDRDPRTLSAAMQAEVERLRADVPIVFRTLSDVVSASLSQRRFHLTLLGVFAAAALLIAVVGIFAAVSYIVGQRTQELAIRAALGATRRDLRAAVLRYGLTFVGTGLALGLVGAVSAMRAIGSVIYELRVGDPPAFIAASLLLIAIAVAAVWVPAGRASAVEPMSAIRRE